MGRRLGGSGQLDFLQSGQRRNINISVINDKQEDLESTSTSLLSFDYRERNNLGSAFFFSDAQDLRLASRSDSRELGLSASHGG